MEEGILTGMIVGLSMIILGLLVHIFKLDWMISGYNTLSEEEQANVEISKIRLLFLSFFGIGGLILLINASISMLTEIKFVHPIGIVSIIVLFLVVNYMIGKFDSNKKGGMPTIYRLFHKR